MPCTLWRGRHNAVELTSLRSGFGGAQRRETAVAGDNRLSFIAECERDELRDVGSERRTGASVDRDVRRLVDGAGDTNQQRRLHHVAGELMRIWRELGGPRLAHERHHFGQFEHQRAEREIFARVCPW